MKEDCHLSFLKVKKLNPQANSDSNLVLRFQYALKFVEVLEQKKRIINIDETWINEKDFRRKCWRQRYVSNTIGTTAVAPRITFMVAIDTDGSVFYTLS